jgi:pyruvate/2-oxoglutarate dehydrogenase complex dihydrolipoamide dehydrogenase (E3) component
MTKRGIQILENTAVKEIKRVGDELDLILSGKNANILSVDTVLFARCRAPNNSGLGLEKAGIQLQMRCNCGG